MEGEIRSKGNWISQYNTLATKEHLNVIGSPCKSRRAFTELRIESCVTFDVYWCELWTETRCVIFASPAVNLCHYACGITTIAVGSINVMYRYSPLILTIYNYHPPASVTLILPHNVTCCWTDAKTVPATVQLRYGLHRKLS
jgi:hypothetical protein